MGDYQPPKDWKGPGIFVGYNCSPPKKGSNYIWKKDELDKINPKTETFEHKIRHEISKKSDKEYFAFLKKRK